MSATDTKKGRLRIARLIATSAAHMAASSDPGKPLRKALGLLMARDRGESVPERAALPVEAQAVNVVRPLSDAGPGEGRPICLLVSYSADGRAWPHTLSYARDLRAAGCRVVLILATDRADLRALDPGPDVADALIVRENAGFDFAAWAHVLRLWPHLWQAPALWFTNDSVYHSAPGVRALAQRIAAASAPVIALTGSSLTLPHFQSYFFALSAPAFDAARAVFADVCALPDKDEVIAAYEMTLMGAMEAAGLKVDILFADAGGAGENPTLQAWRRLIEAGFPFVKVQLLRENPYGADLAGWRALLAERGFALADIQLHLGSNKIPAAALLSP